MLGRGTLCCDCCDCDTSRQIHSLANRRRSRCSLLKKYNRLLLQEIMTSVPCARRRRLKCLVIGDSHVGKTSLRSRYCRDVFPEQYVPTVFDDDTAKPTIGDSDEEVELMLFDTTGQSEYDRLRVITYPGTDVVIICFSVACPRSLSTVFNRWLPEVSVYCRESVPIVLVGTQTDLRPTITSTSLSSTSSIESSVAGSQRSLSTPRPSTDSASWSTDCTDDIAEFVTAKQGAKAARRIGADFYVECSALTGDGIAEVFRWTAAAACSRSILSLSDRRKRRRKLLEKLAKSSGCAGRSGFRSKGAVVRLIAAFRRCWLVKKTKAAAAGGGLCMRDNVFV